MFDSSEWRGAGGMLEPAVAQLRGQALGSLSDEGLELGFAQLERVVRALEAERLRWLAEIDRRRSFERHGYLSANAWLADRFGLDWGSAGGDVRMAAALQAMPLTREAMADGELSPPAVRALASAREEHPDAFQADEGTLLEATRDLPAPQVRQAVARWRQSVDQAEAGQAIEALRSRRRLHLSTSAAGMVRMEGELDPENGGTVTAALRAVQDASWRGGCCDSRSAAQARADALGEICRQWLDRTDRPLVAGERPHLTVLIDVATLARRTGDGADLDHVGPVDPELARQVACDASIARVVMRGGSEPLDVGRRTPVVPASIRRAVAARDRQCRFPGCDRPPSWCDAHHVVHWADGGITALPNLVLLCRRHHRLVHMPGGFRMRIDDGWIRFLRPDGTELQDRGPPKVLVA